ncbi:MAG: DNA gyrase/topoisomerase IV subunit A, partial [Rikenellaceae bacterium]|nr:DNA gyrase/topoisomerase IV subunit A [Rikenellaceae bacterium]
EELNEDWHKSSLEKIFIENKLYKVIEGTTSQEHMISEIDKALEPYKHLLQRDVTKEDIIRLSEIPFKRTSRFDSAKADEYIKGLEKQIKECLHHLAHLTAYAIAWYEKIRDKHGKGRERKTEIRPFDSIEAAKVVVANAKLYVNREEGFFGIGPAMRKDEYVCDCSDIDDVIVFTKEGKYIITKVSEKAFFARDIYYIGVFKRGDERTIYNVLYRDGRGGPLMMKRCAITSITREREYDMTRGTPKSDILYMSVNPNGEAEVLKVYFKPRPRLKKLITDLDFSTLAIKGRASQGNLFSRYPIHKIVLKERGTSTLGGQMIYFDEDVRRLNADGRGILLGEFKGDDKIIVWTARNEYYTTGYDLGHHFPEDTVRVAKYDSQKVYSVVYWDAGQKYYYLKRFQAELTDKMSPFVDDDPSSKMICIAWWDAPQLEITFGGNYASRPNEIVDVAEFIGIKSHRAKGKRLTTYDVASIAFLPAPEPEPEPEPDAGPDDEGGEGFDGADDTALDMFEGGEDMDAAEAEVEGEPEVSEPEPESEPEAEPEPAKKRAPAKKAKAAAEPVEEPAAAPEPAEEPVEAPAEKPAVQPEPAPTPAPEETPDEDFGLVIERAEEKENSRNPEIQQLDLF